MKINSNLLLRLFENEDTLDFILKGDALVIRKEKTDIVVSLIHCVDCAKSKSTMTYEDKQAMQNVLNKTLKEAGQI